MNKLIFVTGAPATGKTYFINQNYGQHNFEILNVYDYQQRIYDENGIGNQISSEMHFKCLLQANELLLEDIVKKLTQGRDVVVEQTLYKAKRRIAYIDEIRKIPDVTIEIEIYVMCPSDELWKLNIKKRKLRGEFEAFKSKAKEIEFPNAAEGFDSIYEVVDGEIKLQIDSPIPEILETGRKELIKEEEKMRLEDEAKSKKLALIKSMHMRRFWHYCEVCSKKELLTAKEAYNKGWDYPPSIGVFGVLSPRTCGSCSMADTIYMKLLTGEIQMSNLTEKQTETITRIKGEPLTLIPLEDENNNQ